MPIINCIMNCILTLSCKNDSDLPLTIVRTHVHYVILLSIIMMERGKKHNQPWVPTIGVTLRTCIDIGLMFVVEEMESEEEDTLVSVGGRMVPLHEVTDEMVARMSPEEKEAYIRLGQELYQNMYE